MSTSGLLKYFCIALLIPLLTAINVRAEEDRFKDTRISAQVVGDHVYKLTGQSGSVKGMRDRITHILEWLPGDANVIPGHGLLSNRSGLKTYLEMLNYSSAYMGKEIRNGTSLDALLEKGVDAKYASWGAGFINEERWIRIVHASLTQPVP